MGSEFYDRTQESEGNLGTCPSGSIQALRACAAGMQWVANAAGRSSSPDKPVRSSPGDSVKPRRCTMEGRAERKPLVCVPEFLARAGQSHGIAERLQASTLNYKRRLLRLREANSSSFHSACTVGDGAQGARHEVGATAASDC